MPPPYVAHVVGAGDDHGDVVAVMSWAGASGRRLARHGLLDPLPSVPAAVTAMAGAHAQLMSAAEVSVALRVDGATRLNVASALWQDRSVVKTLGPRGTVHLLASTDLPAWTAALSVVPRTVGLPAGIRLDATQTADVVGAIGAALVGGPMTVEDLDAAVVAACGPWAGELNMPAFGGFWPRWRQAIAAAAAA